MKLLSLVLLTSMMSIPAFAFIDQDSKKLSANETYMDSELGEIKVLLDADFEVLHERTGSGGYEGGGYITTILKVKIADSSKLQIIQKSSGQVYSPIEDEIELQITSEENDNKYKTFHMIAFSIAEDRSLSFKKALETGKAVFYIAAELVLKFTNETVAINYNNSWNHKLTNKPTLLLLLREDLEELCYRGKASQLKSILERLESNLYKDSVRRIEIEHKSSNEISFKVESLGFDHSYKVEHQLKRCMD